MSNSIFVVSAHHAFQNTITKLRWIQTKGKEGEKSQDYSRLSLRSKINISESID